MSDPEEGRTLPWPMSHSCSETALSLHDMTGGLGSTRRGEIMRTVFLHHHGRNGIAGSQSQMVQPGGCLPTMPHPGCQHTRRNQVRSEFTSAGCDHVGRICGRFACYSTLRSALVSVWGGAAGRVSAGVEYLKVWKGRWRRK